MRPSLIVLNGPPGAGKSTIARLYVAEHAFALRIDIDELRGTLGRWEDDPLLAGQLARTLATSLTHTHLCSGRDVVIAQLYGRGEHLLELERTAQASGASFHEFVLMVDVETSLARFVDRGGPRLDQAIASPDGLGVIRDLHQRVADLTETRPDSVVLQAEGNTPTDTYVEMLAHLGRT